MTTNRPIQPIRADVGEPIIFRTTTRNVYRATVTEGSIWLRSADYFQRIEDEARKDHSEGINSGATTVPLLVQVSGAPEVQIEGSGRIGQRIRPHYILSMHGSSIEKEQLRAFGGYTFGIRSIAKLAAEIVYRASQCLNVTGYRYGQVYYQHAALAQLHSVTGSAAIDVSASPPVCINPLNTDVLRKLPVTPFIGQDEWRIAVLTNGYISDDPATPLALTVSTDHFYPYLIPEGETDPLNDEQAA